MLLLKKSLEQFYKNELQKTCLKKVRVGKSNQVKR